MDKNPTSFQDWLTGSEPVFWIQGKPGSGKSTLMDYLSMDQKVSRLLGAKWSTLRFFFDFHSGTNLANTFEGLLRSLLLQMFKKGLGLKTGLAQSSVKSHVPDDMIEWDLRSLQDAFYCALTDSSTALCLFIDGLDEYGGDLHELVRFFFSISKRCDPQPRHKVCLASRPEEILALELGACPGFRMQDHNTQGIEEYVRDMLDSRILPDERDRDAFSELVARKAEGMFLWARFAVSEVIRSFARGENLDELNCRLDEVPLEMNTIYSKILGRISTDDLRDARLMFQLVCFAEGPSGCLTLLQLKEAVAVAKNRTGNPAHECMLPELQTFRRDLRAKSGGLLEEFWREDSKCEEELKNGRGDRGGSVRLIHRTVKSCLDEEGWLLEWQMDNECLSPHALWLNICCKHVQSILGPSESRSQYTDPFASHTPYFLKVFLGDTLIQLIQYASNRLFDHARAFEERHGESSYKYLSLIAPSLLMYLRDKCRPLGSIRAKAVDWVAIDRKPDTQPWQIVVEQGLTLCSGDVIKKGLYAPQSGDEALSIALGVHGHTKNGSLDATNDSLNELVTLLLKSGAVVSRTNIIMCLRYGNPRTLEILLDSWSKASIEAEAFDFISEVTLSWQTEKAFENMLDLLLASANGIIQASRPDGNVLHSIIASTTECASTIYHTCPSLIILIERGANIKVYSFQFNSPCDLDMVQRKSWLCSLISNQAMSFRAPTFF